MDRETSEERRRERDERIRKAQEELNLADSYRLVIDNTKSVDSLLHDGHYLGPLNRDITSVNFPNASDEIVSVEAEFLHIQHVMSNADILSELDSRGLRPATMTELMTLAVQNMDIKSSNTLVALGSSWTNEAGTPFVGCLHRYRGFSRAARRVCVQPEDWRGPDNSQQLELTELVNVWEPRYIFLAIPLPKRPKIVLKYKF